MGSALETLCGQAYGAGRLNMLGVYMQRSWVILIATAFILMFLYIFAAPLLHLIGQTDEISAAAGKLAVWMIPQLYAYALIFPIAKFLQSQSKIMAMAWISAVGLALHTLFSWLFMLKLGWGLGGRRRGAERLVVVLGGGTAVLFAGYLKNAEVAVDALSICTNLLGWAVMVAIGCNAAISVRVSNELGAAHPRTAKFSVVVVVISSFVIGLVLSLFLIIFRQQYPSWFSESTAVKKKVYELTPLLAFCIIVNNIQPALSGVAIGAGWQAIVAYVNIACYYLFGIPIGLILGYKLDMGVKGIWYGMLTGTIMQTIVLFCIVYRTNWNKEASVAASRINQWGGEPDVGNDVEKRTRGENSINDPIVKSELYH
ncbi:MATE efflux family protein [Forsythia ovata]|uniref:MATE efflux family protein n=1 Tax=Forsythia ovata TaxID=205694 RepID=A0ABD1XDG6_9LAMI